jgi:hypothetical protein
MSDRRARFLRRLAARRAAGEAGQKFGADDPRRDDRRQAERRTEPLTGEALERRLRELGLTHDRRVGQRRSGADRRR